MNTLHVLKSFETKCGTVNIDLNLLIFMQAMNLHMKQNLSAKYKDQDKTINTLFI